jgi:hypothetical protein
MIGTYGTDFGEVRSLQCCATRGLKAELPVYLFGCATGVAGRGVRALGW